MDRRYLFVPPEEYTEVEAQGAHWDDAKKCWYLNSDQEPGRFSKWLGDDEEEGGFTIISSHAYVASASISCPECQSTTEVICIYCETGTASGDPLTQFTVADVWAVDDALAEQLEPWPDFRQFDDPDSQVSFFANHCGHCGALQDDLFLHSEPGEPFFNIPRAVPGSIKLTPLIGPIQLSGNEHFEIT